MCNYNGHVSLKQQMRFVVYNLHMLFYKALLDYWSDSHLSVLGQSWHCSRSHGNFVFSQVALGCIFTVVVCLVVMLGSEL